MSTTTTNRRVTPQSKFAKRSKSVGTVLIEDSYKGNPTIGVWEVDESGNSVGTTPIICFGYNKARAIVDHMPEIIAWVSAQEAMSPAAVTTKPAHHRAAPAPAPTPAPAPAHLPPVPTAFTVRMTAESATDSKD
jgi:hypothetical protein